MKLTLNRLYRNTLPGMGCSQLERVKTVEVKYLCRVWPNPSSGRRVVGPFLPFAAEPKVANCPFRSPSSGLSDCPHSSTILFI